MDHSTRARQLLAELTLEEKAALCTGSEFYRLRGVERLGLPDIYAVDGPHGLRKQKDALDHLGISGSIPATCFPTASASACTFDRDLITEMGAALGEECRQHDVAVLLGPGVNMKRSPLCGRNFEYFSEDPYLAGEMGTAWVQGVQSQQVGASLKHFAANNQERRRLASESVVDERALHEIYLSAFETVVREAQPWTVMPSYNKVRADYPPQGAGRYSCDNRALLTDILRSRWGFEGVTISDWGAEDDRLEGLRAGLDIEMPYVMPENTELIIAAVRDGRLDEDVLDASALRVLELIVKSMDREQFAFDADTHHELARKVAREAAVLLKNDDDILPLDPLAEVAVIGAFAKNPRYQGAGSSKIEPLQLDRATDELAVAGISFEFAEGYRTDTEEPDEVLVEQAVRMAAAKDVVLMFVGLPDAFESEGFDRTDMRMPRNQVELIGRIAEVNPNIVAVLCTGAPVDLAWEPQVKGLVLAYLGGEAGASAIVELLCGKASPCGKLAESWPVSVEDNPAFADFSGPERTVEYRESIFIGYRFYDTARKEVRYPFGYGLSYTRFEYSGLRVNREVMGDGDRLIVTVDIANVGERAGAEIAQLYVSLKVPGLFTAEQELKGFERVELEPGEAKTVDFVLDARAFSYYDTGRHDWCMAVGEQGIRIGSSSRHIRLFTTVLVKPDELVQATDLRKVTPTYFHLNEGVEGIFRVPREEFEALYGSPLPPRTAAPGEPHDANSTLGEVQDSAVGRFAYRIIHRQALKMAGGDPSMKDLVESMMTDSPLRMLLMVGGGKVTSARLDGLVMMTNHHFWKGLCRFLRG